MVYNINYINMNSKIFLTIGDKKKSDEFVLARSKEITHFSLFIFGIRSTYVIGMVVDYFSGNLPL